MIRLATPEDFPIILNMYKSMIGRPYCVWTNEYPDMIEINNDYEHDNLYVFTIDDEIIGAVSVELENDAKACEALAIHDGNEIEIARVCIRVDMQGRGLAKQMIREFADVMREKGHSAIQLLVAKKNPPAIHTYTGVGFEIKGETFMYNNDYHIAELVL